MSKEAEKQDLGISKLVGPDANWRKPDLPKPSQERLDAASSHVNVHNTDEEQTHVIMDRFMVGQEIRPKETKELEMLNTDIEYFIRQRVPRTISRIVNSAVAQIVVRHPIEIRDEFQNPFRLNESDTTPQPVIKPSAKRFTRG